MLTTNVWYLVFARYKHIFCTSLNKFEVLQLNYNYSGDVEIMFNNILAVVVFEWHELRWSDSSDLTT